MTLSAISATAPNTTASQADSRRAADLRKAAEGFEEMFLATLLKGGRAGTLGDDLTGSSAVSQAQSMLDSELAKSSSSASRLGIADAVERQFSRFVKAGS